MAKPLSGALPTATASFVELRRLVLLLHTTLRWPVIGSTAGRLWSQHLTGRVFAFTVWAACAAAILVPTTPTPAPGALPTAAAPFYSSTEQAARTPADSAAGLGASADADTEPQGVGASREEIELLSECWGASQMQVQEAWQAAAPLKPVLVAILDTGIDLDNPRLGDRVLASMDFVNSSGVRDLYGHGTHVAGTVTAIAPNSLLLNVKVADDRGFCDSRHVAEAIRQAASRGAGVINLSLQVEPSPELEAAVEYAWETGAVLVAAAGMPRPISSTIQGWIGVPGATDGPCRPSMSPPVYPASYGRVIAVTGTNPTGDLAPVSNRAEWVDVAAPGHRTCSDMPNGERGYLTGTSAATAHVSGLAALLCGLAEDKNGNGRVNDEVRHAIEITAEPLAIEGTGSGAVNALAAVRYLLV